jgi:ribose transport system permease protein
MGDSIEKASTITTIAKPEKLRLPLWFRYLFGLRNVNIFFLLASMAISVTAFSLTSPYFLGMRNIFNIARAVSINAMAAAFATIVLISGGIDLSIGTVMNASGVAAALIVNSGLGLPAAFAFGIAFGALVGLINGLLIAKIGINPFIATLGMQFVVRGVTYLMSPKSWVIKDSSYLFIGQGFLHVGTLEIPIPVILMLVFFLLAYLLLDYTRFGKYVYAIGGNPLACRRAGIRVERMRIYVYILSGVSAGFAGLVLAALTGAGVPYAATPEMSVLAGVILGGTGLAGGSGTVQGTLLGILLVGVLKNGLTLLNVHTYYQMIVEGLMLLVAVALDQLKERIVSLGERISIPGPG